MKNILIVVCALVFMVGCVVFDQPGYYDADGVFHAAELGVFTVLAQGAEASGLPWSGVVAGALGTVATVGAWLKGRKDKAVSIEEMVKLFNKLKPQLSKINNDKEFGEFIRENAQIDSKFGAELYDEWLKQKLKRLKSS